jgi:dTDP-4-dehydrorhamnose 3,5-epimerase
VSKIILKSYMSITVTPARISDVLIIKPEVLGDHRGYFFASFNEKNFSIAVGRRISFMQDNPLYQKKVYFDFALSNTAYVR